MGLEKGILSGKEHRKPFFGSKAFDCTCRNHGACKYCENNRTNNLRKKMLAAKLQIEEYRKGA